MSERQHPPGARRLFRLSWRSRRRVGQDVDDELQYHIDHMAAELRAAGWSEADARTEAVRRFGDLERTRDYCRAEDLRRERERRRMTFVDELGQDLRYAVRSLRSSPGFTIAALLTLALGIGANTAIFSVVRGVLLEPLPFVEPDRLVRLWHANPEIGVEQSSFSEPDFLELREQTELAELGGFFGFGTVGLAHTGIGNPERIEASLVTDGFFQVLGTPAMRGRVLLPEEHVDGRNRVVVISHGFWIRRFGADPSVLGTTIALDDVAYQVVGVMPPAFVYPDDQAIDAWVPLSNFGPDAIGRSRDSRFLSIIARLEPGVTEAQLRAEVAGITGRIARENPSNAGWVVVPTMPIRESIVGDVRRPILVLMVAVAMLLLIACVNIASLLLARATGRQRELAVRAALGAGRARIARQLLTESLTLALLGGGLGVGLGVVAVRAIATAGAAELPRAGDIRVDGLVLAFTLAVSIASGLLFGLAPTLRASSDLERSLRSGARGSVGGAGQRLRSTLVVVEVALAVVLVIGAGLATKSFARLLAVDPGFRPSNALVVSLSLATRDESLEGMTRAYYALIDAVRAVPGVEKAGSIRSMPLRSPGEMARPGYAARPTPPGGNPPVQRHHVSTDYFEAIGTPVVAGRPFTMADDPNSPPLVVINEELARRAWPGEDAVGKALLFGEAEFRIIGVVGDVRQGGLAEAVEPAYYIHVLQNFRSGMNIILRVNGEPRQYVNAVRQAIWSVDPTQTIASMATLEEIMGTSVARPRLLAWLLGLFGIIGLVLGALGIFGCSRTP